MYFEELDLKFFILLLLVLLSLLKLRGDNYYASFLAYGVAVIVEFILLFVRL